MVQDGGQFHGLGTNHEGKGDQTPPSRTAVRLIRSSGITCPIVANNHQPSAYIIGIYILPRWVTPREQQPGNATCLTRTAAMYNLPPTPSTRVGHTKRQAISPTGQGTPRMAHTTCVVKVVYHQHAALLHTSQQGHN